MRQGHSGAASIPSPPPTTRAQVGDWLLQLRIDKKLRDESKSNKTHRTAPAGHGRECGRGDPVFASSEHRALWQMPRLRAVLS